MTDAQSIILNEATAQQPFGQVTQITGSHDFDLAVYQAISNGDLHGLEDLMSQASDMQVNMALCLATKEGQCPAIQSLLGDPRCRVETNDYLALITAIEEGQVAALKTLLLHLDQAPPLIPGNPLVAAAERAHETVVMIEALLPFWDRKGDVTLPLRAAAGKDNVPAMERLLQETDVEEVARRLGNDAQMAAWPSPPPNRWRTLENLAMVVADNVAKGWIEIHGVENFPRWHAQKRAQRAQDETPEAKNSRPRARP